MQKQTKEFTKEGFGQLLVLGQFNKGFIIAFDETNGQLFVVD